MSSKQRRRFDAQQRARIVRRHLSGKVPISDLADEFGVQPSQIHAWVRQELAQAEKAFERSGGRRGNNAAKDAKIAQLEEKLTTKKEVASELMEEMSRQKDSQWGTLKGRLVPHDTRDETVDYIGHWTVRAELPAKRLLGWLGLGASTFHDWKGRYGKTNEHNGQVPRGWWLADCGSLKGSLTVLTKAYRRLKGRQKGLNRTA
jgi:transposase-like protein